MLVHERQAAGANRAAWVPRDEFEALLRRVEALERRRGPRDTADRDLLPIVAASTAGLPFTAKHLVEHARRADPRLLAALLEATIDTPGAAGCFLRRMAGEHDGTVVKRLRRHWLVTYTSTHRSAGIEAP